MEQLRQRLAEELAAAQQSLREEHEAKVASLRRELASEQVEEEQRMRAEQETTLEALRAKVDGIRSGINLGYSVFCNPLWMPDLRNLRNGGLKSFMACQLSPPIYFLVKGS